MIELQFIKVKSSWTELKFQELHKMGIKETESDACDVRQLLPEIHKPGTSLRLILPMKFSSSQNGRHFRSHGQSPDVRLNKILFWTWLCTKNYCIVLSWDFFCLRGFSLYACDFSWNGWLPNDPNSSWEFPLRVPSDYLCCSSIQFNFTLKAPNIDKSTAWQWMVQKITSVFYRWQEQSWTTAFLKRFYTSDVLMIFSFLVIMYFLSLVWKALFRLLQPHSLSTGRDYWMVSFLDIKLTKPRNRIMQRSNYRQATWNAQCLQFARFTPVAYKHFLVRYLNHHAHPMFFKKKKAFRVQHSFAVVTHKIHRYP